MPAAYAQELAATHQKTPVSGVVRRDRSRSGCNEIMGFQRAPAHVGRRSSARIDAHARRRI